MLKNVLPKAELPTPSYNYTYLGATRATRATRATGAYTLLVFNGVAVAPSKGTGATVGATGATPSNSLENSGKGR